MDGEARNDKSKEVSALSNTNQYIDATRILKGLPPVHGFFVTSAPAPKEKNLHSSVAKHPLLRTCSILEDPNLLKLRGSLDSSPFSLSNDRIWGQ